MSSENGHFCTVINCMDGRTQIAAIEYLCKHCNTKYVDSITEPGPVKIIAEYTDLSVLENMWRCIDISVNKHNSCCISIVAHHDCAGNPLPKSEQIKQLEKAVKNVKLKYPDIPVEGIWIDENWQVDLIIDDPGFPIQG